MNDRYLFRGKRVDSGEWVIGGLQQWNDGGMYICKQHRQFDEEYEVIPESVGQCTGLKDKNGKRIFEGDVLRDQYSCERFGYVGVVKYNVELTQFQIVSKFYPGYNVNVGSLRDSIRILGNQYDRPELLEVKE